MTPGRRDIAEFLGLCFRYRLLPVQAAVTWADEVIAQDEQPPAWALDLAFAATPYDAEEILRHIPGQVEGRLPSKLLLELLRRMWRAGRVTIEQVRQIGWDVHCAGLLPRPQTGGDWGVVLECEMDDLKSGFVTEAWIRRSIDEKLVSSSDSEVLLPCWAVDMSRPE